MAIDNRYEFLFYIQCRNGNPNGDPDMGNAPRWTLRTSMATSRTWPSSAASALCPGGLCREARHGNADPQRQQHQHRNWPGPRELAQVELSAKGRNEVYAGRKAACQLFYDVRTFGAADVHGPQRRAGAGDRSS